MTSAFLDRMNGVLPKPLVFALHGCLGCLLAALLLGEPLWWLLVPPPPLPPAPHLQIAASPAVTVEQGGRNSLQVQLLREHFEGEVVIECLGLPADVQVETATNRRAH